MAIMVRNEYNPDIMILIYSVVQCKSSYRYYVVSGTPNVKNKL